MTPTDRRGLSWAFALFVAATLTACGGGGTHTTSPTTLAGNAPSSGAPTLSTVKATGGGDFCAQVADSINNGLRRAGQTDTSPAAIRARFEDAKRKGQQALDIAPSQIRADLRLLLDASTRFGDALARVNYDYSKLTAADTASLSTPAVQTASTNVFAYVKQRCGIDLTAGASARGSTTLPTGPPTTTGGASETTTTGA